MTAHTDIRAQGWVAMLPERARPYALLARIDRPIGVWLLLLPGFWALALAAPGWAEGLWLAVLFAIGATAMRSAGCVVNDLWDRDIDRKVARTAGRPLAAGTVTPKQALVFLALLCLLGLAVLVQLNGAAILLGVASLIPVVLYPLAKRVTGWPQAVLGLVFSWAAPTGYAAATGRLDVAALALWAAGFCWILGYDTIYAHQDREDDAMLGIGSSALTLGARTRPFLVVCYGLVVVLLGVAAVTGGAGLLFWPALLPAAGLLAWQAGRLDIDNPALCLRLFQANREVGWLIAFAFLAGRPVIEVALVAAGGAMGLVLRYLVSLVAVQTLGTGFPWGTLAVNILGSAVIGLMAGLGVAGHWRLFLVTGLLGGFTTFSAFSLETGMLAERSPALAALYLVASLFGGLAAFGAAWAVSR